jgi:uncharacterized phage protein (TIGR02218 family)
VSKSVSTPLLAHLAGEVTSVAWLWKVKRQDGTILGFTTHDLDLSYDDELGDGVVTYAASTGLDPSAADTASDLGTDNLQVAAFLDSDSITETDIRARKYDYATIQVYIVNWADLTMGDLKIRKGTLGEVKTQNGQFSAEIRGLSFYFGTVIGKTFGVVCRADLGDPECTVDLDPLRQSGTVSSVASSRSFTPSAGLSPAGADYFTDGVLTWTSGANNGAKIEIAEWNGTTFRLFESMPFPIVAGDGFTVEPGCNKTVSDCQGKFSNIANMQAEPYMPMTDEIMSYPDATT